MHFFEELEDKLDLGRLGLQWFGDPDKALGGSAGTDMCVLMEDLGL